MSKFILASLVSGIVFGILDGIININPLAQKLLEVYKPLARSSINMPLGMGIDLAYGFIMTAIFLLLYKSLPGDSGIFKGLSCGLIAWFFRTVMYALSQGIMFKIPINTLIYILITGLIEMLAIGILIGTFLKV